MSFSAYINTESKSNMDSPSDIDNFRDKYVDIDIDLNLSVIFPSFELPILEKWVFILLANSDLVNFKHEWKYRPDYVSYEYYNTTIYWYIILYINQIDSIDDFVDKDKIIIPSLIKIQEMTGEKIVNSYNLSSENSTYQSSIYYKRYPLDDLELSAISAREELDTTSVSTVDECELYEKIETYLLTTTDIANKYVDLSYAPANYSSIVFQINGYTSINSYGYDYILKYIDDTTDLNRISWSSTDCTYGNGLETILEAGDSIVITYLYLQVNCNPCIDSSDEILDGGIYE